MAQPKPRTPALEPSHERVGKFSGAVVIQDGLGDILKASVADHRLQKQVSEPDVARSFPVPQAVASTSSSFSFRPDSDQGFGVVKKISLELRRHDDLHGTVTPAACPKGQQPARPRSEGATTSRTERNSIGSSASIGTSARR
jgi:hypothetical protein